ncbi:MAG: glycoside hydrolase family 2 TIM barrel-domain containing protein [Bacillota bacterium]|nr:glycoside hydrolase family 2 TIM barrel-domain containing protein [Bacillota bacterium]
MRRKSISCVLLAAILILANIPMLQNLTVAAAAVEYKGTDIYNGLRGQNFDDGWKFNKGDASNGQSTSFNDGSWSNVTLPHDWSIFNSFNQYSASGSGGGYLDGGIGWYRKTFTVPSNFQGKKVFIEFDGAYMNSQVWINGTSLGTRPYGYSSFEYDLTPYLNMTGNNVIAVKLNNNQPTSRWYSGSGIYRNVWLTALDPVHVAYCGMFVTTPTVSASSATANVSTKILNQGSSAKSVSLTTTILDASGTEVASNKSAGVNVAANANNTFSQSLTVSSPHLWSTSSPYLYTVKTDVVVDGDVIDTYKSTMGFRYFNFSNTTGFSLNGVNMKMNGVCLHHDLGALGSAVNYRAIERELQMMKDMGCNAIRTSHNPPDPELLEICDRLGLMVMDEAFDCWETGKTSNDYHLYFNNWAQTDLQAMVTRDRNHPAIMMYSVGNEIPSPSTATATKLKNWVKDIDSTRPVTWGCFAVDMGDATHQNVASVFDLQGYNYFPYMYDSGHSSHPEWKMFGSETSSAVRSRGIYKTPTTTNILSGSDNQCSSYDNSVVSWGNSAESDYNEINKRNYMFGEFLWTGFDYIGEPTPYGWPSKSSYFGIVDTCGFPKDIYYFYQSKWTTKPMVHILPHWNWNSGTSVDVWAYSNCDTVELFLNGTSLGSKSVGTAAHLSWKVNWASGTLRAKGTKGGTVVYDEVVTAGSASKVQLKPDRTSIKADGKDLVYIETDITDSNNVVVPNASNAVNFSISGPGTIVGVDNGDGASIESYKGNSRKAFSGKCLVIVQPTKTSGTIVVSATSNGLSQASVSITSSEGSIITSPTPTSTQTTVIPTPTPVISDNLALGKTASSDSEETAKGNIASNANDDNALTRWCAADGGLNHWLKIDLGNNYKLKGSEVTWERDATNYKYKIEVSSDNVNWTVAVDKTSTTSTDQIQQDNFTAEKIRYIRVVVTGLSATSWASISEFKVFGGAVSNTSGVDLNNDGVVNMADVIIIASAFNAVKGDAKYVEAYDLNKDGAINMNDLVMIAAKFNTIISK